MPEITVKARSRQDKFVSTEKFYNVTYLDEEELDIRNYVDMENVFMDMPGVSFFWFTVKDEQGMDKRMPRLISSRGFSTLKGGDLVILLDGQRIPLEEVVNLLSVRDVLSVELLKPWQTNAVTFGAVNGAVLVTTKKEGRSA